MNNNNVVEDYLENVIKNSWTWQRLTEEEKKRFINLGVFSLIKGNEKTRELWVSTIYDAYLAALDYKPIGWREV